MLAFNDENSKFKIKNSKLRYDRTYREEDRDDAGFWR